MGRSKINLDMREKLNKLSEEDYSFNYNLTPWTLSELVSMPVKQV
jgi:hypothetical protein